MISVIGDRLLVQLPADDNQTVSPGGIVLVKDPDRFHTPTRGIVVQLGEKADAVSLDDVLSLVDELCQERSFSEGELRIGLGAMRSAPFDVQLGDCVLFPVSAGEAVVMDGIEYCILHERDVIGVVEPQERAIA